MRDDFLSADWADNHEQMATGIEKLIRLIAQAFVSLTAIQFDAPWQQKKCDIKG